MNVQVVDHFVEVADQAYHIALLVMRVSPAHHLPQRKDLARGRVRIRVELLRKVSKSLVLVRMDVSTSKQVLKYAVREYLARQVVVVVGEV